MKITTSRRRLTPERRLYLPALCYIFVIRYINYSVIPSKSSTIAGGRPEPPVTEDESSFRNVRGIGCRRNHDRLAGWGRHVRAESRDGAAAASGGLRRRG